MEPSGVWMSWTNIKSNILFVMMFTALGKTLMKLNFKLNF